MEQSTLINILAIILFFVIIFIIYLYNQSKNETNTDKSINDSLKVVQEELQKSIDILKSQELSDITSLQTSLDTAQQTLQKSIDSINARSMIGPTGPTGPMGPTGPTGPTGIFTNNKEVFSNLTLCNIDATGKLVATSQNVPGVVTTTNNVSTLVPFKIQKGGNVSLIAITASLDPSTTSFATGSTWQFFIGKNGDYSIMTAGGQSTLYFEGGNSQPKTFYFYPGQNGFPKIVLQPNSTISIKGVQLSGILNNVTIGIVYDVLPPSFW